MSSAPVPDWNQIREKAGRYPPQAYQFVREGLAHTVKMIHGAGSEEPSEEESRHVSGRQLCLGLRDFAIKQYGLMARSVFSKWGVRRTEDFGRIVFAMVDAGFMRKTDEDTIEDFRGIFEFDEAFGGVEDTVRPG